MHKSWNAMITKWLKKFEGASYGQKLVVDGFGLLLGKNTEV